MMHYVYFVDHPLVRALPSHGGKIEGAHPDNGWTLEVRDNWLSNDWKISCCWAANLDDMEWSLDSGKFRTLKTR